MLNCGNPAPHTNFIKLNQTHRMQRKVKMISNFPDSIIFFFKSGNCSIQLKMVIVL